MSITTATAVLIAIVCLSSPIRAGHEWSYDGSYGTEHWAEMGFSNCQKHRQSPIAIDSKQTERRRYKPMEFYHFDEIPTYMNLSNNFHSAGAFMELAKIPYIKSGGLPGEFEVTGFHFHWAEDDTKGSEHIIDGVSYPLEMHVVCRNKKYDTMAAAFNNSDGLAVLSVMFEVSESNNRAIGRLEPALGRISDGGSTTDVEEPPRLMELMPWNTNDFYRYDGSLTTPGCYEVVTWTIFMDTVKATEKELKLFRNLKGRDNKAIGHNYRTTQERFGRKVYLRQPETDDYDSMASQADGHEGGGGGSSAVAPSLGLSLALLLSLAVGFK